MNNQDLQKFEKDLKVIMGANDSLRPFVCHGSPLECEVFIVGFNPATEIKQSFWHFWKSGYGFDKPSWFENYKLERQFKKKKISNTRRVLNWITEEADPTKCLETNLYSFPTARSEDLKAHLRETDIFEFLLKAKCPRIIVLHGKDAGRYSGRLSNHSKVVVVPHFAIGWSEYNAKKLGRHIHAAIESGRMADLEDFVAEIAAPKTYFGYRDEDLKDDFWKIIEEAKELWSQKTSDFMATHPVRGSFHVMGAGIYIPFLSPGKRKPKGKRVIFPPFSNDASTWSESGPEIVRFLHDKGISCRFEEGIDD